MIAVIQTMGQAGMKAEEIQRTLDADPKFSGRVPHSLKTIRSYVKEAAPPDPSEAWVLLDDETDDPGAVLTTLAAALDYTRGRVRSVTIREAALIATLSRVAPDLLATKPVMIWRIARMYRARELHGWATHDLDALLAYSPWREAEGWQRYRYAVEQGWIPEAAQSIRAGLGAPGEISLFDLMGGGSWQLEALDSGNYRRYQRPGTTSEEVELRFPPDPEGGQS